MVRAPGKRQRRDALGASRLVGGFPALQANVARAFLTDKMSVTLTPAQFATEKAKLLRGLPSSFVHLLQLAATAFQPATVPEVALLRAGILNTSPIQQVLTQATPRTLALPAALAASSVTAPEVGEAAALKSYGDNILQPVAPSALGGATGGLEPAARFFASGEEGHSSLGESLGEALHVATDAFQAAADGRNLRKRPKPPKPSSQRPRVWATRSPPSLSMRPTQRSAKVPRPARVVVGAAKATVAPLRTASPTSRRFPEPATPSKPLGSSRWPSRRPTTSTSRSVSSASRSS